MASCTCNFFDFFMLQQQLDYVLKFPMGLNDYYASVRSKLLLAIPLPSMAKVFSLILQEESQRQLTNSSSTRTYALMAKQFNQSSQYTPSKIPKEKSRKSSLHCTHCGYNKHTIYKYF